MTRITATEPVHRETERWPPSGVRDEVGAVLPKIFEAVTGVRGDEQPCGPSHRGRREYDEHCGDDGLDDDDDEAPIGHRQADVDRGDQCDRQRVHGRRIEPREGDRRQRSDRAEYNPP